MGWVISSACNSEKQKNLIIDVSDFNSEGNKKVELFMNYIREKDKSIKIKKYLNDYLYKDICIKYYTNEDERIIYYGSELNEEIFDSLYRQIVIMND